MAVRSTYTNPVYGSYFADPFVLKYNGEYYAYGTFPIGECKLPILHSKDLVSWRFVGDALKPAPQEFGCYWAPEVAYQDGTFYMYYSAGGHEGEGHQLRVATALEPTGPFEDLDIVLAPHIPFTIDAHPFRDDDGTWYLFYSLDVTEGNRPGTSIVVDRLADMTELAGEQQIVVRPHAEWNLYQRQRQWLGRVWDWYTIEGAFVCKHNGRYYCFYSGGAWREPNYGVGVVVADHPLGPYTIETSLEWPEVLRTIPERVVGPGHTSVTLAPDNLHPYMVYHAWDPAHGARLMRIDPLVWTEHGPVCSGPSTEPQPAPPMPLFRDLFDDDTGLASHAWDVSGGAWRVRDGQAVQESSDEQRALALLLVEPPSDFLLEVNAKQVGPTGAGAFGLLLAYQDDENYVELAFDCEREMLVVSTVAAGAASTEHVLGSVDATGTMRLDVFHQLIVKHVRGQVAVQVDGIRVGEFPTPGRADGRLGLFTRATSAAFDGVALTSLVMT